MAFGGKRCFASSGGSYMTPGAFTDARTDMVISQEEIFGPVIPIEVFESIDEAITKANATKYGLWANVWTESLRDAMRFSREIRAGTVAINNVFGGDITTPLGGMKESGIGKDRAFGCSRQVHGREACSHQLLMNDPPVEDRRNDFSGECSAHGAALKAHVRNVGVVRASGLVPRTLAEIGRLGMESEVAAILRLSPREMREHLVSVLTATERFDRQIVEAVTGNHREILADSQWPSYAYLNAAIPLQGSVAIPSPWLLAYAFLRIGLVTGSRFLLVGMGSGYSALSATKIVGPNQQVDVLEIDPEIARASAEKVEVLGGSVRVVEGDARSKTSAGLNEYDAIWNTLAFPEVPNLWEEHLAEGGLFGTFLPSAAEGGEHVIHVTVQRTQGQLVECFEMSGLINSYLHGPEKSPANQYRDIRSSERYLDELSRSS